LPDTWRGHIDNVNYFRTMNTRILVGVALFAAFGFIVAIGLIGIATPAMAQNMTGDNATMMGGNMTAGNMTTGSSDYTPK
jgi:acetamidase/formamidase